MIKPLLIKPDDTSYAATEVDYTWPMPEEQGCNGSDAAKYYEDHLGSSWRSLQSQSGGLAPAPGAAPQKISNLRPYKVLYIEDSVSNLKLVKRILRDRPQIQFLEATRGLEGLVMACAYRPDLILLDAHLPDISGQEFIFKLYQDDHTAQIPVVIISADAMPQQVKQFLALGVLDYLTKPINIKYFLSIIDHLLAEHNRCESVDLAS